MLNGKTKTGFKFQIEESLLDNMELVDAIAEIEDDPDPIVVSKMIKLLFTPEEKAKLYDHIRDKSTGRVPLQKLGDEITNIFYELSKDKDEVKN